MVVIWVSEFALPIFRCTVYYSVLLRNFYLHLSVYICLNTTYNYVSIWHVFRSFEIISVSF